jgi:hypothetical protein
MIKIQTSVWPRTLTHRRRPAQEPDCARICPCWPEVEIKADTFNFTRYGLIHGHVANLSQDAITRDKPQDNNPTT